MSIQSSGASIAAPHPSIANLWVRETDSQSGLILTGYCHGAFTDTTAGTYEHAAQITQTDASSGLTIFVNTGTTASPSWTQIGNLPPGDIALTAGQILVGNTSNVAAATKQYGAVSVVTNGATLVPLFSSLETPGSLTGIEFTAADDANGTITVTNNGVTIATIVKGSQGNVKGSSIAASAFVAGGSLNVVSTAGNGTLTATFITG